MIITASYSKRTGREAAEARGLGDLRKIPETGPHNSSSKPLAVYFLRLTFLPLTSTRAQYGDSQEEDTKGTRTGTVVGSLHWRMQSRAGREVSFMRSHLKVKG